MVGLGRRLILRERACGEWGQGNVLFAGHRCMCISLQRPNSAADVWEAKLMRREAPASQPQHRAAAGQAGPPAQVPCCLVSGVPWLSPQKHQQPGEGEGTSLPGDWRSGECPCGSRESQALGAEGGREEQTYFLLGIQGLAGIRGQALGHLTASQESIETKAFFDLPHS